MSEAVGIFLMKINQKWGRCQLNTIDVGCRVGSYSLLLIQIVILISSDVLLPF
jgi:hypothetical protein